MNELKQIKSSLKLIDTKAIEDLGFQIISYDATPLHDFINKNFPNFNLPYFLEQINQLFSPPTSLKTGKKIVFDCVKTTLQVSYINEYQTLEEALVFVRDFLKQNGEIIIEHSFFILPEVYQGQGIAIKVFQESLQQYINMAARKIKVHAALAGGGYAWAKHGFVAINQPEVEVILQNAKKRLPAEQFNLIKVVYNHYYQTNAEANAFPIIIWANMPFMKELLRGSNWYGELDLKNQEQFANFIKYVFR